MFNVQRQLIQALRVAGIARLDAETVFGEFVHAQEQIKVALAKRRAADRTQTSMGMFDEEFSLFSPDGIVAPDDETAVREYCDSLAFQPVRTESHHPVSSNGYHD